MESMRFRKKYYAVARCILYMDEAMYLWMGRFKYGWGDFYMDEAMYIWMGRCLYMDEAMYTWIRRCIMYIWMGRFLYGWDHRVGQRRDSENFSAFSAGAYTTT
jgi:hypothetical protein